MAHVYDMDCELGCKLLKAERNKLEALKTWLIEAKAQGRISMSVGFSLDEILGAGD